MRLAEYITAFRAWSVIASLVQRKPGVLRPSFVGMRGQWSYDYGMQDYEYPPLTLQIVSPRQVVDDRLRSFHVAGARVQSLMLERLAAIFARLRTFELVEGGRRSLLPRSGVANACLLYTSPSPRDS